jgi:hypothetical protein
MVSKRVIDLRKLANDSLSLIESLHVDLMDGVERGLLRSLPDLVKASPVDTGQFASSWAVERPSEDSVLLLNSAPHAAVIEYGARPFTPPIGPLLAWAKRVLQDPKTPNDPSNPNDYGPNVRALAFAVQAKIAREGMEPHHIVESNLNAILANIIAEWKAAGG